MYTRIKFYVNPFGRIQELHEIEDGSYEKVGAEVFAKNAPTFDKVSHINGDKFMAPVYEGLVKVTLGTREVKLGNWDKNTKQTKFDKTSKRITTAFVEIINAEPTGESIELTLTEKQLTALLNNNNAVKVVKSSGTDVKSVVEDIEAELEE